MWPSGVFLSPCCVVVVLVVVVVVIAVAVVVVAVVAVVVVIGNDHDNDDDLETFWLNVVGDGASWKFCIPKAHFSSSQGVLGTASAARRGSHSFLIRETQC